MSEVLDRPSIRQQKGYKVLGTRAPRIDGVAKVTGARQVRGRLLPAGHADRAGAALAARARAHHPPRRVEGRGYPGVVAVVTGADLEGLEREPTSRSQNIVAKTQVLFAGQPVAAVAALTKEIADEALALIEIEYEVLQPILDPVEAMKRDAPVIKHEGSEAGIHIDRSEEKIHAAGAGNLDEEEETEELNNVSSQVHFKRGDLAQGFEEADAIVEGRWISSSVHQGYMEPHGTVAHWDAAGNVSIWTLDAVAVQRPRLDRAPVQDPDLEGPRRRDRDRRRLRRQVRRAGAAGGPALEEGPPPGQVGADPLGGPGRRDAGAAHGHRRQARAPRRTAR